MKCLTQCLNWGYLISYNGSIIGGAIHKDPRNPWGGKEAEEFARNLSGKCLPGKRNIYQIKKNDNLGRIAEGLTRGRIQ